MSNSLVKSSPKKSACSAGHFYTVSSRILHLLSVIFLLAVLVLLPLYNKGSYARIGSDKREMFNFFLQIFDAAFLFFLLIHLLFCLLLGIRNKTLTGNSIKTLLSDVSPTDFFVLSYMLSVLLSWLCSSYRSDALMGAAGWTMGALMQLSLCGAYFLITRFLGRTLWPLYLILPVSAVLFLLGYLNRFNIWPIPMELNTNPQFISLAGNINWFCGYMVTVLFGVVFLAVSGAASDKKHLFLISVYLFLGFCALVTNGSSSGILTLLVVFFLLFLFSASDAARLERFCHVSMLFALSCLFTLLIRILFPYAFTYQEFTNNLFTLTPFPAVILFPALGMWLYCRRCRRKNCFPAHTLCLIARILTVSVSAVLLLFVFLLVFNTLFPGKIGFLNGISMFTFSPSWGSRRGATWMAGFLAWQEQGFFKKLIGVGPDSMGQYLYNDASGAISEMLRTVWPDNRLDNAHCELLTILVNLGVFGLVAYTGILVTAIRRFMKYTSARTSKFFRLPGACAFSILAYAVHNLVSFQQVLNLPVMFVLLAVGEAWVRNSKQVK